MDNESFDNNYKKLIGIVKSYDGEVGNIITYDKKYHFCKKDVKDKSIENDKLVEFYPNTIKFCDEKILLAKKIEELKK